MLRGPGNKTFHVFAIPSELRPDYSIRIAACNGYQTCCTRFVQRLLLFLTLKSCSKMTYLWVWSEYLYIFTHWWYVTWMSGFFFCFRNGNTCPLLQSPRTELDRIRTNTFYIAKNTGKTCQNPLNSLHTIDYKSKTKSRWKKLLQTKLGEGKGYTFSLPASTKITREQKRKDSIPRIYRRAFATAEQPSILDCSRETKACMGNHGTQNHALNRGCGVVPSAVTAVLWRNLVSSLVQPEWTKALPAASHIQQPATHITASELNNRT